MVTKQAQQYLIGYIFKPTHNEVHYVRKEATGNLRRCYSHNFTTDRSEELKASSDLEKAKNQIVKLVNKFHDDIEYTFTPVLINAANNTFQRYLEGKWLDEAITPFIKGSEE